MWGSLRLAPIKFVTVLSCDKIPICGCSWWLRYYNYLALEIVNKSRLRDFSKAVWCLFISVANLFHPFPQS